MLRQLKAAGVTEALISVGHLAELLEAYLRDGSRLGLPIRYVREDRPLGTIGPLALVNDLPEHFLLMNGDVLTDLDYAALFRAHVSSGAMVSISTYRKKVPIDLGVLVSDAQRVIDYIEKPTYTYDVSMGVYALSNRVLEYIPRDQYFDFPSLIKTLLAKGHFVNAVSFDGIWLDIGRPTDYQEAQETFSALRSKLLPDAS